MKDVLNGGLVDFKEHIIFEKYKDEEMGNSKLFKEKCEKELGYKPSSALYRQIINYQIKTYGSSLVYESKRIPKLTKNQLKQTRKHRQALTNNSSAYYKTQALIDRAEKRVKDASK